MPGTGRLQFSKGEQRRYAMKKKAIATTLFLAIFSTFLYAPTSSWAGSPQSHRWEGVAIGIGAAIIGSAILNAYHDTPATAPQRPEAVVRVHYRPAPPQPTGYWQIQKQWVPPVYQKVWHPGHTNRHGRGGPGRWVQTEIRPGYWVQTQVWIPVYR
jgi:hypothetical protein